MYPSSPAPGLTLTSCLLCVMNAVMREARLATRKGIFSTGSLGHSLLCLTVDGGCV